MKKTFLRILPVVAAVLLATSCSKDDNGDVNSVDTPQATEDPNPTPEQSAEQAKTVKIPFSVNVDGGESLSKITYALQKDGEDKDIWNKVTRSFDDDDLPTGKHPINLKVTGDGITESTIPLTKGTDGKFYFEGEIEVASEKVAEFNSETGIALVGEFSVTGTALPTSSAVSLAALMTSCAHTYKTKDGEFTSKSTSVTLYDQNVYLAVQMSPLQHTLDVKINDAALSNCNLSNDGQVWIALEGGKSVDFNFLSKSASEVAAGHIYTINRERCVDLGIKYDDKYTGDLWADRNIGATNVYDYGNYYTFNQTNGLEGETSPVTLPWVVPTGGESTTYNPKYPDTDFKNLYNSCTWTWTSNYSGRGKAGYIVYKRGGSDISKDPHIFLPAAGYCLGGGGPSDVGNNGHYWSSTVYVGSFGFKLYFKSGNVSPEYRGNRVYECPVRAVRRK
jgi:hypothetical protein